MLTKFVTRALFGTVLLCAATPASAQINYPGGYGGYGWGGWGGGGGGVTAEGDIARGMGVFAAGAGYYNLNTAEARSINANTAVNWNEYWYQSQQAVNHKYYQKLAAQRESNISTHKAMYERIRDNPNQYDIYRGDALNVIYDDLCNPKVYMRGLKTAGVKFPGEMIRDLPFQSAQAAVTATVRQILKKGSEPAVLKTELFKPEMAKLDALAAKVQQEDEKNGAIDVETLDTAEMEIKSLMEKVAANVSAGTKDRNDADRFLKAALGLCRMLRTPAINVLLSDADKHPETTVGDLLGFMKAFNLRFGVADDPRERAVYNELYPLLSRMRDEAFPNSKAQMPNPDASGNAASPVDFFATMDQKALTPKNVPPPRPQAK